MKLENISRLYGTLIIDQLVKGGVTHFYLSPGMRNAPLIKGLLNIQKKHPIEIYLGIDERSQSFRALGAIKALKKPVALVCTSGTALANYFPAVIEAYKSRLPLIIVSADRPHELNTSDANQTIQQQNIYGSYTNYNLNFGVLEISLPPKSIASDINFATSCASMPVPGPVHINVPFREPIGDEITDIPPKVYREVLAILENDRVHSVRPRVTLSNDVHEFKMIANLMESMAKKPDDHLIAVGTLPFDFSQDSKQKFIALLKNLDIPFCVDITSGIKHHFSLNDNLVPTLDHPEVLDYFTNNPPSKILHFGGRSTSKFFYEFLKNLEHGEYYHVSETTQKEDPSFNEYYSLSCNLEHLINYLYQHFKKHSSFLELEKNKSHNVLANRWKDIIATKRHVITEHALSYPSISKIITDFLITLKQKNHTLYLGNSTIIRSFDSYIQEIEEIPSHASLNVYTHRGVSGIEGFLSAAIGACEADGVLDTQKNHYTLVNGDMATIHDLNAFCLLKQVEINLTIVIVNNFGGGIFTLLPINRDQEVLNLITTPHEHTFLTMAQFAEVKYLTANTQDELKKHYEQCLNSAGVKVLEVFIDGNSGKELYDKLKTIRLS